MLDKPGLAVILGTTLKDAYSYPEQRRERPDEAAATTLRGKVLIPSADAGR
jgi:hypothetical protein